MKILAAGLICIGALVMLLSIIKYKNIIRIVNVFFKNKTKQKSNPSIWYKVYHILMHLFLVGYIIVLVSIIKDIDIAAEFFTSLIFFFGALFVFIGIYLQMRLLTRIQHKHDQASLKNEQLLQVEDATIYALAYLAEIRDSETGKHIERTSQYVQILAEGLRSFPQYRDILSDKYIEDITKSAPLHDIGKVGVPDSILKKNGKLSPEEFTLMKLHCKYGAEILTFAAAKLHFESYLSLAIPLVCSHHEKWDGTGYPEGLKGSEIPLSAQVMALADVYDALRSKRCYKDEFSHGKSMNIIHNEKGKHFSPDIVDVFIKNSDTFLLISTNYSD